MSSPRVWFITGASSGFGYALAVHILTHTSSDIVVATMRNPVGLDSEPSLSARFPTHVASGRLLLLKLDVTHKSEIASAFAVAKKVCGRIDIVFNNAGWAMIAEVEGTPDDKARELFETNFWGAANVSREAVNYFRENNPPGGVLLQTSSNSALNCNPGAGYYGASKAALEALSVALRQELDPAWNTKIVLIEPGPFDTKAIHSRTTAAAPGNMCILPPHPCYTSPTLGGNPVRQLIATGEVYKIAGNVEKAGKIIYGIGVEEFASESNKKDGEVSQMGTPVKRVPLHPIAIQCAQAMIESLESGIKEFSGADVN